MDGMKKCVCDWAGGFLGRASSSSSNVWLLLLLDFFNCGARPRAQGNTGKGRRRRRHTSRASGGYRVYQEKHLRYRRKTFHFSCVCVGTCGPFEFPRASYLCYWQIFLLFSYFFAPIISVSLLVVQRETKGLKSHGVYKETKSTYQAASGGCVCVSVWGDGRIMKAKGTLGRGGTLKKK